MATIDNLKQAAMNRHRLRLFGDAALTVYTITPEAGETLAGSFSADWFGQRVTPTTSGEVGRDQSEWQFQIAAAADWETSQAYLKKAVSLTIGGRRWKIIKIERPIGISLIWKVRAQEQA